MKRRPRRQGSGVLLTEDWIRLACVGVLMMVGTIAVLDAYYPGGLFTLFATGTEPNADDEAHARTMAFTTLMMFQLFDVYNCRSRRRSAFMGFLENKWLLVAIAFSLGTHILVIYVPALQTAFHTVPLSRRDWMVATAVAASLLFAMEIAKIVLRRAGRPHRLTGACLPGRSGRQLPPGRIGAQRFTDWYRPRLSRGRFRICADNPGIRW